MITRYHRREIKGSLGFFAQGGPSTETVLTLLLESGVAYILYWVSILFISLSDPLKHQWQVIDCILGLVVVKGAFSDVAIFTNTFNHISVRRQAYLRRSRLDSLCPGNIPNMCFLRRRGRHNRLLAQRSGVPSHAL